MREQERRRLIKQELDKQVQDKANRNARMRDEQAMYDKLQEEHVQLLADRERQSKQQQREKIMAEKESRDRQFYEE